jgi:hypothetical protein
VFGLAAYLADTVQQLGRGAVEPGNAEPGAGEDGLDRWQPGEASAAAATASLRFSS